MDKNYDKLLPTMEKIGFIQKGEQVSTREIDDMLQQYVEPLEVPVFHYTRKWLQRMAALNMDRAAGQIKAARQMDIPAKLAIPMRVIASIVAISCQLDAHVPTREIADEMVPGFANPDQPSAAASRRRAAVDPLPAETALDGEIRLKLRRRPCGAGHAGACARRRSRARRSRRPTPPTALPDRARRSGTARRIGQSAHSTLARSRSVGFSANHRSGSPAWHGSTGSFCSSVQAPTVRPDMSFTCFLVSWLGLFFARDPGQVIGALLALKTLWPRIRLTSGPWPIGCFAGF